MENEKEEKKVDTQTTGNDTQNNSSNQNSQVNAIFGNQDKNSQDNSKDSKTEKEIEKPNNELEDEKEVTDVSNQNKNEGEKGKKTNSIAQRNEDGSITFKSQEELDGFIARKYAQGAEKATLGETSKQKQNASTTEENVVDNDENKNNQNSINTLPTDYYSDKIGIQMAIKGVNPTKLQRASRLVDQSKVIVNGVIDQARLEEEINAIISEFPELIGNSNQNESKGFKFGAAGNQTQDSTNNINDEIDSIFGNK